MTVAVLGIPSGAKVVRGAFTERLENSALEDAFAVTYTRGKKQVQALKSSVHRVLLQLI